MHCSPHSFCQCQEILSHPIMQLSSPCTPHLDISPSTHLWLSSLIFHTPPPPHPSPNLHQTLQTHSPLEKKWNIIQLWFQHNLELPSWLHSTVSKPNTLHKHSIALYLMFFLPYCSGNKRISSLSIAMLVAIKCRGWPFQSVYFCSIFEILFFPSTSLVLMLSLRLNHYCARRIQRKYNSALSVVQWL